VFTKDLILRDTAGGGIAVVSPSEPRYVIGIEGGESRTPETEGSVVLSPSSEKPVDPPSVSFKEQRAARRLARQHKLARIPKAGSREQAKKIAEQQAKPKSAPDERQVVGLDELMEQM
jgi:hypothetical protein